MINTVNTKKMQLETGYFKIDSGNELVLVIGSCRSVPYLNYLHKFNKENKFTIAFIDPFNFCYDLNDNRVSVEDKINSLEKDENVLSLLKSTAIIIHEHYTNYGMFNFDKEENKNIYQFGLNPEIDICIPNWNNNFVLFGDIVSFDLKMRGKAIADFNVLGKLSQQTQEEIFMIGCDNFKKFFNVCLMSDIPEMKDIVYRNGKEKRFFWNHNHVTKNFTTAIFDIVSKKIGLNLGDNFYDDQPDMFANNYTYATEMDIKWWQYQWGEEIKSLRDKL